MQHGVAEPGSDDARGDTPRDRCHGGVVPDAGALGRAQGDERPDRERAREQRAERRDRDRAGDEHLFAQPERREAESSGGGPKGRGGAAGPARPTGPGAESDGERHPQEGLAQRQAPGRQRDPE